MAKVGDAAHTSYGLGTITEVETVRGRSSFRVAGNGFNIWLDETKLHVANNPYLGGLETTIDPGDINEDNHTTLPYDCTRSTRWTCSPRSRRFCPVTRRSTVMTGCIPQTRSPVIARAPTAPTPVPTLTCSPSSAGR